MKRYFTPIFLALAASSVLTVGLSTGKALLSIFTVVLAFSALWNWVANGKPQLRPQETKTVWWMVGLFLIAAISGIWTENSDRWLTDIYEKIPLLLLPLAIYLLPRFSKGEWRWNRLIFLATQSVVAIATLIRFALNYEEQMQRVAENSYIDIVGSISHIYFGVLLGWSAIIGIHLWLEIRKEWKPAYSYGILFLTLINAVAVHILVSRTGLLSFYIGLLAFGSVWLWQVGRQKLLLVMVAGMVLTPVIAYYAIPSFGERVRVTIWDAEQYYYQTDLTDNSLSLRLLAWESSWGIIQAHPWLGVGMEDVGAEMLEQYKIRGMDSRGDNLLTNPHNQYLKQWAGAGPAGLVLLLLALFQPVWEFRRRMSPLVFSFAMTMAISMCFESLLERQIGMSVFVLFGMWLLREEWGERYEG